MRFKSTLNLLRVNVRNLSKQPFGTAVNAGMSMIEIMIVISLIAVLMTYIIKNVNDNANHAKEDQAKIAINMLVQDLQRFKFDNGRYPTTEQGLNALLTNPGGEVKNWRGPYTEDNKLVDPWQQNVQYESDGRTMKISSSGADTQFGTADDVVYPAPKQGEQPQQ
jgi:general secretion pathway protein G